MAMGKGRTPKEPLPTARGQGPAASLEMPDADGDGDVTVGRDDGGRSKQG